MTRSAFYAWGGPGTIRLLKTKYFSPKIHQESFLSLYDRSFLDQATSKIGLTDMFVTYSWGFSDRTERGDRSYITSRLTNFTSRSIHTYAYIQGLNLVTQEFSGQDLWCRNSLSDVLRYSKGRSFTCPNNPKAIDVIRRRVEEALKSPFAGIYVDNILFGLPPFYIYRNETSFFGCSCRYCQQQFKSFSGYSLPLGRKKGEQAISDYLLFRRETIRKVVQELSLLTRSGNKTFGINLYDPFWHSAPYYFGYDLSDIDQFLDYYLFENHALQTDSIDNRHLVPHLGKKTKKPTFVVSYRNGIGRDSAYIQRDIDNIFSESKKLGYIPCYKATEYKTDGVWHALNVADYHTPSIVPIDHEFSRVSTQQLSEMYFPKSLAASSINTLYEYFAPRVPENPVLSKFLLESPLYANTLKTRHYF